MNRRTFLKATGITLISTIVAPIFGKTRKSSKWTKCSDMLPPKGKYFVVTYNENFVDCKSSLTKTTGYFIGIVSTKIENFYKCFPEIYVTDFSSKPRDIILKRRCHGKIFTPDQKWILLDDIDQPTKNEEDIKKLKEPILSIAMYNNYYLNVNNLLSKFLVLSVVRIYPMLRQYNSKPENWFNMDTISYTQDTKNYHWSKCSYGPRSSIRKTIKWIELPIL